MTRLLIGFVALILGIVLAGVATLQSSVLILSVPLLAYLFSAIYQRPEDIRLSVARTIFPDHAPQDAPLTVTLVVTNVGRPLDEVIIAEELPHGAEQIDGQARIATPLAGGATCELQYTIRVRRGQYDAYRLIARARDTGGFFEQSAAYRAGPRLVIRPRYPKLDRIKVRPPQTRGFAGPIAARQGGVGIDFYAIREYQPGDPRRQINWRMTARTERGLFTNVYEQERVADVSLILDARQRLDVAAPGDTLFEHSVRATAALAESFLADGNRVSLLVYGSGIERVFPGYGRVQKDRILKALAKARPELNYALQNLTYLPTRFFPAGSQIVFISPLVLDDLPVLVKIRTQGYAVMVISPDSVSFAAARLGDFTSQPYRLARAERELVLQQIRRSGLPIVDWRVDQPLEAAIRATVSRPIVTLPAGWRPG